MPLFVGGLTPPPPPPVPVPVVLDEPRVTWFAPDGTQWPLTSPELGWHTLDEVTGWGAAPIRIVSDPHPRGGARVRHVQPQPRLLTWPVRVRGSNHTQLVQRWRDLVQAFTQTRRLGPGVLRVARPDGTAREIQAWYEDGFAGEPGQGWLEDTAVLGLFCEDPYWRAVDALSVVREFVADADTFLSPFPHVSSALVLGETTVVNAGDVEAWPEWTITGPADLVTATNNTTGEEFVLDPDWDGGGSLGMGDTVTITTDPPTVRGPAGEVWTGALNWPGAVLWGLLPGSNDVEFTVAGAAAGTRIELSYKPRYETA